MTQEQVKARTKTVTRRVGWQLPQAGRRVERRQPHMGFKKGEHPSLLAKVRVVT
jgi:hypothetical protein